MKKLYRNVVILIIAACFSTAAGLSAGEDAAAQTKTAAKTTPTPKAKSSAASKPPAKSTPVAKAKPSPAKTDKPPTKPKPTTAAKPNAAPKPTQMSQVIIAATASRIRREPKTSSAQLSLVKLGKLLPVSEKNAAWYRVEYAAGKSGWISKTLIKDYEADRRDDIYLEIADKYSAPAAKKPLDFATAAEVSDFLATAQLLVRRDASKADLGFRRLRVLNAALRAIPFGKGEQPPYKNFLKANEKDVAYSEPSGEWYVRSDLYWELHNRFTSLPVAEEIAWQAAQNPIPGECEGYVNCYLYYLRATSGEYLNFYPNGKYSKKALTNITNLLEPIIADLNGKTVYTPPSDISDRAEFNRFLTELRTIISKMPDVDKAKTLQQINQLGEGYK